MCCVCVGLVCVCSEHGHRNCKHTIIVFDLRPALVPEAISGQGLVWRVGHAEELIRFAFLNKVPFTGQQLGMMAKSLGISLRMVSKTASVDQAAAHAKAIADKTLPELEQPARLSLIRAIVEPSTAPAQLNDPVLALILDDMAKDNPSYKDFEKLHQQVKGHRIAPARDENDDGRAGRVCGPTIQVTDMAYRVMSLCCHCN